jgi:pilus assembly protein CpaE
MLDVLGYPRESWQVVLNRSDSRVGLSVDDVTRTLKVPLATQIPSSRSVSASINKGVPIVLDEPKHPVSTAIKQLVEHHIRAVPAPGTPTAQALEVDNRAVGRRGRPLLRRPVRS